MMVPILEKIGKGLELQPNAQGITWRCWQFKDMNETHTEKGNTLDTHTCSNQESKIGIAAWR